MSNQFPIIDLRDLHRVEFRALTRAKGADFAEAAAYCLEISGHLQGVRIFVQGLEPSIFQLTWAILPANVAAARADLRETTERGASGIAILLARTLLDMDVVYRSHQGSGFDYVLRKVGSDAAADEARLEISGILNGTASEIRSRVVEKAQQVKRSEQPDETRPAYVIVVEFSRPTAMMEAL